MADMSMLVLGQLCSLYVRVHIMQYVLNVFYKLSIHLSKATAPQDAHGRLVL